MGSWGQRGTETQRKDVKNLLYSRRLLIDDVINCYSFSALTLTLGRSGIQSVKISCTSNLLRRPFGLTRCVNWKYRLVKQKVIAIQQLLLSSVELVSKCYGILKRIRQLIEKHVCACTVRVRTSYYLGTICGDACPLSCVGAEAGLAGWPNAQGRRDGGS